MYLLGGASVEAKDAGVHRLDVVDRRPGRCVDDVVRLRRPLPHEVVPDVPFCRVVADEATTHTHTQHARTHTKQTKKAPKHTRKDRRGRITNNVTKNTNDTYAACTQKKRKEN